MRRACDRWNIAPLSGHRLVGQKGEGDGFEGFAFPSERFKRGDWSGREHGSQIVHDGAIAHPPAADHDLIDRALDPSPCGTHSLGRPHAAGGQEIFDGQPLLRLNAQQFIGKPRAELLPARGFGRTAGKKGMGEEFPLQATVDFAFESPFPVTIHELATVRRSSDEAVQHHIRRPGIKRQNAIPDAAARDVGDIADSPEIHD